MHFRKSNSIISALLCFCLLLTSLTGCQTLTTDQKHSHKKYDKFITVDVYDSLANYQGIQSGWFAKIVKDRFNMKLNIIAPNVYGSRDALFETRSGAGNLGDLIITSTEGGIFEKMISSGLLYDMTDLIADRTHLKQYSEMISTINKRVAKNGMYGIPSEISTQSPLTSNDGVEPQVAPYVRWDAYRAAGYPQMNTLEDYLTVMKKMQSAVPTSDSGKKTYALSLFKDWDDNMIVAAKNFASLYGYTELGFTLTKADGSDIQDITDKNSIYVRALRFLFEANQADLVDPESTTQNYNTLSQKYQDGQILTSLWSYQGQSLYNTDQNVQQGKGFMPAFINDSSPVSYGCYAYGNAKTIIGIGKNTDDPERLADFIDWLYSPEGMEANCASNGAVGPEGLTWKKKDGKAILTKFGQQVQSGENPKVPKAWGGKNWTDGISALNFKALATVDPDPNTGEPYLLDIWSQTLDAQDTPLKKDWQAHNDNAQTSISFLENKKALSVSAGSSYTSPKEDSDISTIRRQCKPIITDLSWKMIFAKTEKEFNNLLQQMQNTVYGMGYKTVLKNDMNNAKEQIRLQQEEIQKYKQTH